VCIDASIRKNLLFCLRKKLNRLFRERFSRRKINTHVVRCGITIICVRGVQPFIYYTTTPSNYAITQCPLRDRQTRYCAISLCPSIRLSLPQLSCLLLYTLFCTFYFSLHLSGCFLFLPTIKFAFSHVFFHPLFLLGI
jgi:hypothetical protein